MSVVVSRIFHAGYQFVTSTTRILFDPIFENPLSVNCYSHTQIKFDFDEISKQYFDAIIISHVHDDHLSLESLQYLDKKIPIYLYCHDKIFIELIKKLGFEFVYQLHLSEKIQINDFFVTCLPALDRDVDCLFHIQYQNIHILNVVDSWIDWDTCSYLSKLATWNLILWPFQQMRELEVIAPSRHTPSDQKIPPEHLEQLIMLNPQALIPSSCQFIHEEWSWYRKHYFPISYRSFAEQLLAALPNLQIIRLESSSSISIENKGIRNEHSIPWIQADLNSTFDYDYQPDFPPQNFQEIVKHFPDLSHQAKKQIDDYLRFEIVNKWSKLDPEMFIYPNQIMNWKMIVYRKAELKFNSSLMQEYCFQINKNQIFRIDHMANHEVHWLTEIIDYKLDQALFHGESLSSLYIRINDRKLTDLDFPHLVDFEMIADPLLRILYEGNIARYQIFQLKKIMDSKKRQSDTLPNHSIKK